MRRRRADLARRPRVLDEVAGQVRIEHGNPSAAEGTDRLAILAQYSTTPAVSRSFREFVREVHEGGYRVVVVSASEFAEPLDFGEALPESAVVLRKPNVGYDFGSWAVGLDSVAGARSVPNVLLANDSMVGPFWSLSDLLARFEATTADVFGLTDSYQYSHHLQSFFVGYRNGALAEEPLRRFWADIRQEQSKIDIVLHNEIALGVLLRSEGFVADVACRSDELVPAGENPTLRAWWRLLEEGVPFVKREILVRPHVALRGDDVPRYLRSHHDIDVTEWL